MSVDVGIVSLRPKIITREPKLSEVVIKEAKQGSEEACLKIEVIGNPGQLLETIHSGKQMQALTSDQEQSERCFKEVEKLESKEASSLSLTMEKENREVLYRDILESGKPTNGGPFGE